MARKASPARWLLKSFDHAAQPIYLIDAQRHLQYANEACCQWLGQKLTDLIGQRCDFSTVSAREQQSPPVAALGPPEEAFTADVLSGEVCGGQIATGLQVRTAIFLSIAVGTAANDQASRERSVLVMVGSEPTAHDGGSPAIAPGFHSGHIDLQRLRAQIDPSLFQGPLIGQSHALKRLREQVKVAQHANVRVLLIGPAGSGRRQLARAIHYAGEGSNTGPLAAVVCPVMDAELMQLTLTRFLRQREGQSFRRPPALLLTDVDQLRADAQQELAGFLLLPGVELQTISTATRSLHKLAARGRFRQDLAFALSTFTLTVPPLTKRLEDVPLLAQYFIEQHNSRSSLQSANDPPASAIQHTGLADDALDLLQLYPWPRNVEELSEIMRAACERAATPSITAADLPEQLHHGREALLHQRPAESTIQLSDFLAEVEKELLTRALQRAGGNKTKAAELLGLQRSRLIRRLVQLGLQKPVPLDEPVVFEPIVPDSTK